MSHDTTPPDPINGPLSEQEQADHARYLRAAHAVQSAVAFDMELPEHKASQPKHLRVGIDMTFVGLDALQRLCIEKGLFTRAELYAAQADAAEREVARVEALATKRLGTTVTFG